MQTFKKKAPKIMASLMAEFKLTPEEAAAILGNLGHESGGFTLLQEIRPVVKGSRGGYGWAQWTGPRRKQFEAWCKAKALDPASDEANYGFLVYELRTTEVKAIPALKAAQGLNAKVIAFENNFERSGVKHYPSRLNWAKIALAEYRMAPGAPEVGAGAIIVGTGTALAVDTDPILWPFIALGGAIVFIGIVLLVRWFKKRQTQKDMENVGNTKAKD